MIRWVWLAFLLQAVGCPVECSGQTSQNEQSDASVLAATFYGGAVIAAGDHVFVPPWLFLVGAQFSLRRSRVEWVVLEPFGMFSREGSGITGGLQSAWNLSPVEHGPYLGFGGALLSPTRGKVGFLTGRVGIRRSFGETGARLEVQYLHKVAGGGFASLVNLILGLDISNGL